jgi:hypothetical protein
MMTDDGRLRGGDGTVDKRQRARLATLVRRFVEAESWAASRVFAERHPELLSGDADAVLTWLRDAAADRGDAVAARAYADHQRVLRRYREHGASAFDELITPGVPGALRPRWVAAEAAYERYRARPGRTTADAAALAVMEVVSDRDFVAVPAGQRAGMRQAAGTVLGERYQRYGGPAADLDGSVACFTAAVAEVGADDPDRPSYVSALGNVLGMRYECRGDPADLDAGIRWSREAARNAPSGERWWLLHNLSANLGVRHEMRGEPADLAEAIETARVALACEPPESARPVLASTLAGLYLGRYECDGALDDLRSAIDVARAGGGAAPRLERAALLVIHAVALDRYADHVRAPGMREEAAGLLAKAARLLPRGSSKLATCLSALGQTHLTRFRDTAAPADLLAARDAFARALRNLGQGAPRAALVRSSMGTTEVALAALGIPGSSVETAIRELQAAADEGAASTRLRPFLLANLAAGRAAQHRRASDSESLQAGVTAYQEATREGLAHDLEVALNSARDWGDWAAERQSWREASTAYGIALDAADRIRRHQPGRAEKEIWLGSAQALGWQAGQAAARAGLLELAVAQAERGRAQLLAEELSLGQLDMARLSVTSPELASRYAAAAGRVRGLDAAARGERSGLALSSRPDGQPG